MFDPNLYRNENRDEMLAFITQHSFGICECAKKSMILISLI
jgi:predicted FMN-binding regulatory protein PaiB